MIRVFSFREGEVVVSYNTEESTSFLQYQTHKVTTAYTPASLQWEIEHSEELM